MRLLTRNWMLLVAVIVFALAGFAVYRLHGIFGSNANVTTAGGSVDQITPFNPKNVVLEVFGEPGASATITYLDVNATPKRVDGAPLPWVYQETTTTPAVVVNIQAQGDGSSLGCRITVDGVVKSQRTVNAPSAYTYCLDKSG